MKSCYRFFPILAITSLTLLAASAKAEEIVWKQPPAPRHEARYHENLHFEGNSILHRRDVMKLQRALASRGFYRGNIDGLWGGQTTQAILDYQGVHQQALTGTVTPDTLRDLGVQINPRKYRNEEVTQ
jgi:peptidoglycan hydrolase-like protein with peptidoglycan-binding domain